MARAVRGSSSAYQKTVLPGGLRVVSEAMPSVRSVSLGIWVDVGSRNEPSADSGMSHFTEHMLFKGTRRRTSRQIASALESLGGHLNGFTSRENTCYMARVLDEHLETAIDVLSDMVCHSTLTAANIAREKSVVCEEIKEVNDTPADLIHDLFAETFWGDHPLGRSILGTAKTVSSFKRRRIVEYIRNNYRSGSVVVAAAGNISHAKLVRQVRKYFEFEAGIGAAAPGAVRSREKNLRLVSHGNAQTHLCLGFPGISFTDRQRMVALAINTYLGAGMSSVLFQKIREERGLAYSVYTLQEFYRDAGVVGACLGTDRKHVREALDVVLHELRLLQRRRLSTAKLDQVKSQMKGQLALSMESSSTRMSRIGRHELMGLPYKTHRQVLNEVDRVTSSAVMEMSKRLFDRSRMAVAVLGPADKRAFADVF